MTGDFARPATRRLTQDVGAVSQKEAADRRFRRNRLLGRMLIGACLTVFGLALFVGFTQVLLSEMRVRGEAAQLIDGLVEERGPALEAALGAIDRPQIREVLDALVAAPNVVFLRVTSADSKIWARGLDPGTRSLARRTYGLGADHLSPPIGSLTIGVALDPDNVMSFTTVFHRVLAVLIPMGAAMVAMFFLFDRMAGRHLRQLVGITETAWLKDDAEIVLDRPDRDHADEFDELVAVMNQGRSLLRKAQGERTRQLIDLANLNKKLSDINQEQADFAYAVSHDLRSPNNTARLQLREFRVEVAHGLSAESASLLAGLEATIDRMGRLIEDIMTYSKSIGEDTLREEIDLNLQVKEIMRDLTSVIRETKSELKVRDLPKVHGSQFQIRTLMKNLISNAIKFHDPARGPLVEIFGGPSPVPGWVQVSIRDNGIGIDPEHQEQIFDLFTRFNTQAAYEGSGIGLPMCQRIATDHGGRIEVLSKRNAGSTFTVFLPGQAARPVTRQVQGDKIRSQILRLGLNTPSDDAWALAAQDFAEELRQTSSGAIDVMVLPGRRLANADEILQQVRAGTLDMAVIPSAELANLVPEMGALMAPYLADDFAHAGRILRAPETRGFLGMLEKQIGAVGVAYGLAGFRQIALRGDVRDVSQLADMKMRIPPVLPFLDFYEAIGVAPVPVPLQHAFQAFTSGRVDAVDMDAELICKMSYIEHVDMVLHSNHIMFPSVGLVSQRVWRAFSEQDRALVAKLMGKHLGGTIESIMADEVSYFEKIAAAQKTILEVGPAFFGDAIATWNTIWSQRTPALATLREVADRTRDTKTAASESQTDSSGRRPVQHR